MSKKDDKGANDFKRVLELNSGAILGMVMKAAVELNLFEIMAAAAVNGTSPFGDQAKMLSSDEIAAHLQTQNPTAPAMLDRILRFLTAKSILTSRIIVSEVDGTDKSLYGLASICKYYISDEDGVSLAPSLAMLHDKSVIDSWYHLKDAVLEGGIPFNKANGMNIFEYPANNRRFNDVFNQGMYNHTTIIMKKILEVYTGFGQLTEIVDVGGGTGATLAKIISKYPHIKGINFDLPHVIKNVSPLAGVEHVEGDMFERVPKGEVIFMKWILHDWSDDHCLRLLKNCCNALPEFGKIIIVESVVPENSNAGSLLKSNNILDADMLMMASSSGGKERSLKEFEVLAIQSGFEAVKHICSTAIYSVLEFYKKV